MKSISINALPPELLDLIFKEMRPDDDEDLLSYGERGIEDREREANSKSHPNHDLTSCALVNHRWRDLARRHLFHAISFSFPPLVPC